MKQKSWAPIVLLIILVASPLNASATTRQGKRSLEPPPTVAKQRSVRAVPSSRTGLRGKVQLLEVTVAALEDQVALLQEQLERMDTAFEDRVQTAIANSNLVTESYLASQGYLTSESDPTVNTLVKDGVSWSEVTLIPACFADGVDDSAAVTLADIEAMGFVTGPHTVDTTLGDAGIAAFGYIKTFTETDPTVSASVKNGVSWTELTGIPADILDGDDSAAMTKAEIEAMGFVDGPHTADTTLGDGDIASLGYIKSYTETDPTVKAFVKDGTDWIELTGIPVDILDGDDSSKINKAEIEAMGFVDGPHTVDTTLVDRDISNFGYIKTYTETDPTVNVLVKDGVSWSEISSIPAGFADNVDDSGSSVLDPFVTVMWDEMNGLNGPHIFFTGANVHIRSGAHRTDDNGTLTGLGNLIVGYNEWPDSYDNANPRMGPHNLIVGEQHEYPSYGGFVAGYGNDIVAQYANVSGGNNNTASGDYSGVSGGLNNTASGQFSSVSGGQDNTANKYSAVVSGGKENFVNSIYGVISGGASNVASGDYAIVCGGIDNEASGYAASILGGSLNSATNLLTCVSGGILNSAGGDFASVTGGFTNSASGYCASVTAGSQNSASSSYTSVSGGSDNIASADHATVSGGWDLNSDGDYNWRAGRLFEHH